MPLNCGVEEDSRVPWTERRSNQSILKEISPGCSLLGLIMKLKLQYFGHLMRSADSLEKTLMLGKTEGRRRGRQRMRWLNGITDSMDMGWVDSGSWWWTGRPGMLWFMGLQIVRNDWATELNWVCIIWRLSFSFWLASLFMIISRSIYVPANIIISLFFCDWKIFHCIYVLHFLYPFIYQWTFRLCLYVGYYKYNMQIIKMFFLYYVFKQIRRNLTIDLC